MEVANGSREEVRVVAHRKMVPIGDDHLPRAAEQLFPSWLKTQRVVALSEDREHRKTAERPREGAGDVGVKRVGAARVVQVGVKCTHALSTNTTEERRSVGDRQVATDATGR